jgi:hypothetical protein
MNLKLKLIKWLLRFNVIASIDIIYNLPWFCSIKVSYKKSQRNAENACGNRMCKLSLKAILILIAY